MTAELLRQAALCAAGWISLLLFLRTRPTPPEVLRMGAALGLAAAAAHVAWLAFHFEAAAAAPGLWLDVTRGHSLVGVPFGFALAALTAPRHARAHFLAAAMRTQPAAWAVAKLGCAAAGCCTGLLPALPLLEAGAYGGLHFAVATVPKRALLAVSLGGLGSVRLTAQSLRRTRRAKRRRAS